MCVYICMRQLFSLACHVLEIDGEKCQRKDKTQEFSELTKNKTPLNSTSKNQHLHDLEGAVRCVDEPELSNVASWDVVHS